MMGGRLKLPGERRLPVSVTLDPTLLAWVDQRARDQGRTRSSVIEDALMFARIVCDDGPPSDAEVGYGEGHGTTPR